MTFLDNIKQSSSERQNFLLNIFFPLLQHKCNYLYGRIVMSKALT